MHEGRVEPIDTFADIEPAQSSVKQLSGDANQGAHAATALQKTVFAPYAARHATILKGETAVMAWEQRLKALAAACRQAGAANDLPYHLSSRFAAHKVPTLVLLPAESSHDGNDPSVDGFGAAVLLFEYRMFGIGSRVYSTSDVTGRRTVIGPEWRRAELAAAACCVLIERKAEVVLMSLQAAGSEGGTRELFERVLGAGKANGMWSLVERETPLYLRLGATFDETLATIGKKTRTNLRYYRRRAEKELGCRFVPEVKLGLDEFVKASMEAAFPVEEEVARWRYKSLERIEDPLFCGVQDRDGRWLSLAAGRRSQGHVELDWQSNRADLPAYSLSTVLRAYLIEYEIAQGSTRLYIEGTPSTLQRSFAIEKIADVTIYRRSLFGWAIRKLAARVSPERIPLAKVLRDTTRLWQSW